MLYQNRTLKLPVHDRIRAAYAQMEQIQVEKYFIGVQEPARDIALLWSLDSDLGFMRANVELSMLWAAYKRLGLQVTRIGEVQWRQGNLNGARALVLPASAQMADGDLDRLRQLLEAGIHIHSTTDLPGQFTASHAYMPGWVEFMRRYFGLDVSQVVNAFDSGVVQLDFPHTYIAVPLVYAANWPPYSVSQPSSANYTYPDDEIYTWKLYAQVTPVSTYATDYGNGASTTTVLWQDTFSDPSYGYSIGRVPALQCTTPGNSLGKTAATLMAVGDISEFGPQVQAFRLRANVLHAVYKTHFGIESPFTLSGTDSDLIAIDWKHTAFGTLLFSMVNMNGNGTSNVITVTVSSSSLIAPNSVIEDLTNGIIVQPSSPTQSFVVTFTDDQMRLFHIFPNVPEPALPAFQPPPAAVYISSAPNKVWSNANEFDTTIYYSLYNLAVLGAPPSTPGARVFYSLQVVLEYAEPGATFDDTTSSFLPSQALSSSIEITLLTQSVATDGSGTVTSASGEYPLTGTLSLTLAVPAAYDLAGAKLNATAALEAQVRNLTSTLDGGQYRLSARIYRTEQLPGVAVDQRTIIARVTQSIAFLWGVRVANYHPLYLGTGNFSMLLDLEWQELPSYLVEENSTPLARADTYRTKPPEGMCHEPHTRTS